MDDSTAQPTTQSLKRAAEEQLTKDTFQATENAANDTASSVVCFLSGLPPTKEMEVRKGEKQKRDKQGYHKRVLILFASRTTDGNPLLLKSWETGGNGVSRMCSGANFTVTAEFWLPHAKNQIMN